MSIPRNVSSRQRNVSGPLVAKALLILFLGALVIAFDLWVVGLRENATTRGDDFFQFWAAGRALLHGDDPYDPQAWRQIYEQESAWRWQTDQPVFPYPLWTALPFVPLALLPAFWAGLLWVVMSELFLVLSAALSIKGLNWKNYEQWMPLTMALLITFEPVLLTILFGQLGILLLVLACGIFYLIGRRHHVAAGILLGLTLIKPHLFIVVIPILLVVMFLQRRWGFIASFAMTATGLLASSWLVDPGWPSRWQAHLAGTAKVRLTISPTIWGFSHTIVTSLRTEALWVVASLSACLILAGILGYLWYVRRDALREGDQLAPLLSLIMIVSLLVSPYMLSYDFTLLLLPIITCLWLIQPLSTLMRRALLASLIGCATFLPWALLAVPALTGLETASMLLPASLLAILLVATLAEHRQPASMVRAKRITVR